MKERITYWDVARGMAMLLVIFYHVPLYIRICHPSAAELLMPHINAGTYILPFFMPVFFVISGYFTNTAKTYWQFLWGDIKNLLLVGLGLTFISYTIQAIGVRDIGIFKGFFSNMAPARIADLIFCNWFISAIFFARQVYYWIDRLAVLIAKDRKWLYWLTELLLLVGIAIVGILLEPNAPHNAQWYYCQGLVFAIFIAFGRVLRIHSIPRWWFLAGGGVYIGLMIISRMCMISTLEYGMINTSFTLAHWPYYMVLAITGSMLLIGIAQYIVHCFPLEFIGRHTLIFYIPQGGLMWVTGERLKTYLQPDTPAKVWLFVMIMWVVTLVVLGTMSWVYEKVSGVLNKRIIRLHT